MADRVRHGLMSVKRTLLPLVPDRAMSQYRFRREQFRARFGLHQRHSGSRTNVDVVVDRSSARRWLLSSPDTVRIVDPDAGVGHRSNTVVIPTDADVPDAARLLGWDGISAVVVGNVEEPRWGRRVAGTEIEPTAIVTTPDVISEVGGVPLGNAPLPGLLARLVDGGHHLGLIPNVRSKIDLSRTDTISQEPVVILAAVPLHDVGGGSRGAQMALELVRLGYHVTYVNRYPSYEAVDLGLRYIHPNLEQVPFERLDVGNLNRRCAGRPGLVIVELPDPAFDPTVGELKGSGWVVVADLIDDWSDPALGGDWFDPVYEQALISRADAVTASAPDLILRAESLGRTDAVLVANAVNTSLFGRPDAGERPQDLPDGEIIGYHGSLYGDWIDWTAITRIAEANPDATVVLIGEDRNVPRVLPHNIVFLGLKAQGELAVYLQHFTIGFVPFLVTPTTHAVSPLKVYEYLASGLPIAAPPLRSLTDLPDVYTHSDLVSAVSVAMTAPAPDRCAVLTEHSWRERLTTLFSAIDRELEPIVDTPVRIVQRPVAHYAWAQRRVTRGP